MPNFLKFRQEEQETRICEVCGNKFVAGYGYSLALCWLVTGHAFIDAFMCDETVGQQHWGCCMEHALQAAVSCAEQHMIPKLKAKHDEHEANGVPRIAPSEQHLYDEKDPEFHIIRSEVNGN